jgi:hypothetical protein
MGGLAGRKMEIDTVDNNLYIADNSSISRINFDDMCVEVILQNANFNDMAIDWLGRRIFYTEYFERQIFVANFSGKEKSRVLADSNYTSSSSDLSYPAGIALDANDG